MKSKMFGRQFFAFRHATLLFRMCLGIVLLTALTNAMAFEDQSDATESDQRRVISQLIQQLGENRFEVRDRATRQLLEIGSRAEPALTRQLKNPDPEIQYRCRDILELISVHNFERRLEGFLTENGESGDHRLPGWERYHRAYGSSKAAKELFVAMLRTEPELLKALEENRQVVAEMLSDQVTEYQQGLRFRQFITLPSVATMLFIGSEDDVDLDLPAKQTVLSFCYQNSFREGMADGSEFQETLQKILERQLSENYEDIAQLGIMLAMQFDLPVGVTLAKGILQKDKSPKHMQLYAMLTMAKLGDKDDAELHNLLKGRLENITPLNATVIDDKALQTQVRDVALAALLHLQGQGLKQFGFEFVQEQPMMLFAPHTLGFENDEKRSVAFEKWKGLSEKN